MDYTKELEELYEITKWSGEVVSNSVDEVDKDLAKIEGHLARIADALDRAFPKPEQQGAA